MMRRTQLQEREEVEASKGEREQVEASAKGAGATGWGTWTRRTRTGRIAAAAAAAAATAVWVHRWSAVPPLTPIEAVIAPDAGTNLRASEPPAVTAHAAGSNGRQQQSRAAGRAGRWR